MSMSSCKPSVTPGSSSVKHPVDGNEDLSSEEHSLYRRVVGKLMWLLPLRPDIAYSVKELARSLQSPTKESMGKLKHVCR